jgi:hypothetical protein
MPGLNGRGSGETDIFAKSTRHELDANRHAIDLTRWDRQTRQTQHRNREHRVVCGEHPGYRFVAALVVV